MPSLELLDELRDDVGRRIKVIDRVAPHWEYLAQALGFERQNIEDIISETLHSSAHRACRIMLATWLKGGISPVSWSNLICRLIDAGLEDIADDLNDIISNSRFLYTSD